MKDRKRRGRRDRPLYSPPARPSPACGNRLAVRIPDAPVDQWDTAECIQIYRHESPCDDGAGTVWQVIS